MKIRFFLLGTEKHGASLRFQEELKQIFASCLTDDSDVQCFDTIRDATTDIAKAVSDSHALVFIADTEHYASTKSMLAKAFGFGLACDTTLLSKACDTLGKDTEEEDSDFAVAHAFVPKNAKTFVLADGLWSGFSVANGNQTIILLPCEKARTSVLISSQAVPYLNAAYHADISTDALKKYNTGKLFEALEAHNAKLAVSGTNTANFLKEYLSFNEGLSEKVLYSPIAEKRGTLQPVDYVVNLSITAAELMSCPYSVAVSNAFYTGDSPESDKIVYLAVSNERETAVREIHSLPGEDIPSFLSRCCGDLCVFVADVISDDDAFHQDIMTREGAAVKRYKVAIVAVAAVIAALIIFVAAYFTANDYTIGTWYDNFMEWIFPAGNPLDELFENNRPEGDETTEALTEDVAATQESTAASEESTSEEEAEENASDGAEATSEEEEPSEEATTEAEATSEEFIIVG